MLIVGAIVMSVYQRVDHFTLTHLWDRNSRLLLLVDPQNGPKGFIAPIACLSRSHPKTSSFIHQYPIVTCIPIFSQLLSLLSCCYPIIIVAIVPLSSQCWERIPLSSPYESQCCSLLLFLSSGKRLHGCGKHHLDDVLVIHPEMGH